MRSARRLRSLSVLAVVTLGALAGGCASTGPANAPLSSVEQWRAGLCEQVVGVSRMACIQQTAGRPGSPYDAAGRPVAMNTAVR
jgi:hypothetical protein